MRVAVLKESFPGEKRVALVPAEIGRLARKNIQVDIEADAGAAAGYTDAQYEAKGGRVVAQRAELLQAADMVLLVRRPDLASLQGLRSGQTLIGFLDPLGDAKGLAALGARGINALSMELMPRVTRAQGMDALSSMANIAGYKAVLLAASHLPRMFPMMMTAAGTVSPAKVLVLGAGVAGLQAIATARRLGAVVEAYDVRPEVREQIQSVGGKFIDLGVAPEAAGDKSGYARAQSEDFYRRQQEQLGTYVRAADAIITTAAIPGRRAPVLITADMLRGAKPGSVVVDLAAETGGNCALTRPGETVLWEGIAVLGPLNVPSTVPFHASQLYARNVSTFVDLLCSKEGQLALNTEDEIIRETLVIHAGNVVHNRVLSALTAAA